jgi:hypothetical protein
MYHPVLPWSAKEEGRWLTDSKITAFVPGIPSGVELKSK